MQVSSTGIFAAKWTSKIDDDVMNQTRQSIAIMRVIFVVLVAFFCTHTAHATSSWCGVPDRTPDGFVNLRSGPAHYYSIVGRVVQSDSLLLDTGSCRTAFGSEHCDESGKWSFVEQVHAKDGTHSLQTGWINTRYVRQIGCINQ